MTLFVFVFLPETKGVPIEETASLWRKQWSWKRLVTSSADFDVHGRHGSSHAAEKKVVVSEENGDEL